MATGNHVKPIVDVPPAPTGPAKVRRPLDPWQLVLAGSFLLLGFFIIYPLAQLFLGSVRTASGGFTLGHFAHFFATPYYRAAFQHSLAVGALVTLFSVLLGVPLAVAVARWGVPGRALLRTLVVLPLVSPPFIGAYSWIMLLGRNGWVTHLLQAAGVPWQGNIYGLQGIVLALTLNLYPFVFLLVAASLSSLDAALEEASANLGAAPWATFRRITVPLLMPAILGGGLLVFLTALADFGSPMIIGMEYMVLPTLIYSEYINDVGGQLSVAATASVILLACCTAVLLLERWYLGRRSYAMSGLRRPRERNVSPALRVLASSLTYLAVGISLIPAVVVLVTSFFPSSGPVMRPGFSLGNYQTLFYTVPRAMFASLTLSGVSTLVCVVLGVLVGYLLVRRRSRWTAGLDTLLMVPYAVPGTVLAVALISAFSGPRLILVGTVVILVVSYTIRRLPYAVRGVVAILHHLEPAVEEASVSLGASPARTFARVTLPLLTPGIVSGAVMTWVQVVSEISSTILLFFGEWKTMPVVIYQQVMSDNFGTAAAASTLLLLAVFVPLLALNLWQGEKAAELV